MRENRTDNSLALRSTPVLGEYFIAVGLRSGMKIPDPFISGGCMKLIHASIALFGLLISDRLFAQHAPVAEKNPLAGNASAAEAGKRTYVNSCQICHGGDGGGGRGPALATREFRHGGEDWQLFQTIRDGVPGTQMPGFGMSSEELWQVVTYLRTLTPAGKEEAIQGDALAGEQVFFGKGACQLCHQVNGRGGRVGPDFRRQANGPFRRCARRL